MLKIKICCISSLEEANIAIDCGASALGLVSEMPSGPGVINNLLIKEIASNTPPCVDTFLLTSKQSAKDIIEQQKILKTNTIQICDRLIKGSYEEIKNSLPGIRIVQVIHVVDESSVEEAVEVSKYVDAILLDSGNQSLNIKELGGTGKTHNWELSKKIKTSISKPLFLAGGLNSSNVKEAIEKVQPYGVDICSGVRTNGKLDRQKLELFINIVRSIK